MKRAITVILLIATGFGAGVLWIKHPLGATVPGAPKDADDKPPAAAPAEEDAGAKISHDDQGNTVITISDDEQGDAGIVVGGLTAAQWSREIKGYARVLDPSPIAALASDLASAQVAAAASAQEYERQKTLTAQNNSSARALQAAQAAAQHDEIAVQSARDHIGLAWGKTLAGRTNLAELVQSLVTRESVLVRVDLQAGETMKAEPTEARLVGLSGGAVVAKYLGEAVDVDPQLQGEALLFTAEPGTVPLAPGAALTAFLKLPAEPLSGVVVPRDAVVRAEGAGWVYVMGAGGEVYTRMKVALDRPTDDGWFVAGNLKATDKVVVTGAQTLLSEELKAALSPD